MGEVQSHLNLIGGKVQELVLIAYHLGIEAGVEEAKEAGYVSPSDGTTRIFSAGRELKEDEYQDYLDDWAKANGYCRPLAPDSLNS